MQRGLLDPEKVDPFSLFVETGGLTYCLYKDSERILGNTFGMCILQVAFLLYFVLIQLDTFFLSYISLKLFAFALMLGF